jgi:hypothetical protein
MAKRFFTLLIAFVAINSVHLLPRKSSVKENSLENSEL